MLRKSTADAERLLSETRAQAAALARRAEHCISKLHTAYLQKIEGDIGPLAQVAIGECRGRGHALRYSGVERGRAPRRRQADGWP